MKVKCIIIDDEYLARQLLEGYVRKMPYLELVGLCESALEAIELLQHEKIDLIFLDVNMPEIDGINFIKSLKDKPEIIITTAYSEHALDGYHLDVIEYLLKPIYFERFVQAVNKAKNQIELKLKASQAIQTEAATITSIDADSFFIKTGPQKISRINLSNVLYIESLHEYIRIHLEKKSYTIHYSLKSFLDILPSEMFIQIHRSYIVNFNRVTSIEGNTVIVDNVKLSLGKNFREEFINKVKAKSINIYPGKPL